MLVTEDLTRAELQEALVNLVATLHRMPEHWVDKRAGIHGRINDLLDELERV